MSLFSPDCCAKLQIRPDHNAQRILQTAHSEEHAEAERHRAQHLLVSVMLANNEIGTIEPISALAAATHKKASSFIRMLYRRLVIFQ